MMMEGLMYVLILLGLIVVLLLLTYLIDRVNTIEKETRALKSAAKPSTSSDPYLGLRGRKLWDAMISQGPSGVDPSHWASVRNRYALLLQLHIEHLFEEGKKDAQRGMAGEPKNPRGVHTPDGDIESWLPPPMVKAIYQCGLNAVQAPEAALPEVRLSLNSAARTLYEQTGLNAPMPLSDLLLPGPLPSEPLLGVSDGAVGDQSQGVDSSEPPAAPATPTQPS